ncbi:putative FBD-associated F-box protein At5g50270 [Rutidosis leptorrhynchoides]|uniref:putative FBD-associated F-box protein At5g50270 n=1 Tax=Rutidosis leptorrhynchoides TaxID=125765 RepID=UPI003A991BE4
MNARSGKVVSKRPKHSSTAAATHNKNLIKNEEKEDIFSKLPDELFTNIISLIPDARDAKRTCILSKRWNYIWEFLPILCFVMPFLRYNKQENEFYYDFTRCNLLPNEQVLQKFNDSVDKALALRNSKPIQKFFLCLSKDFDYSRVLNWLRIVISCLVQQLELILAASTSGYCVRFYWGILKNCDNLIELTLNGKFVLDVPESNGVLFPSLKKLILMYIIYSGENTFVNVISQCPVLEELIVKKLYYQGNDLIETFKVSSASLKSLSLSLIDYDSQVMVHDVFIDAPNLEYIYMLDEVTSEYHMTESLSLVEAHIDTSRRLLELFTSLSSIKKLTLTRQTIRALNTIHSSINVELLFPNLVKLLIGISGSWEWDFVLDFLNHMPYLKHIPFTDGLLCADQIYLQECNQLEETPPPSCLLSNVKEIVILNLDAILWEEFAFIKYLLNNANKLETLKIIAPDISPKRRAEIFSLVDPNFVVLNLFEASPSS